MISTVSGAYILRSRFAVKVPPVPPPRITMRYATCTANAGSDSRVRTEGHLRT
jgi:hypothetical protein